MIKKEFLNTSWLFAKQIKNHWFSANILCENVPTGKNNK